MRVNKLLDQSFYFRSIIISIHKTRFYEYYLHVTNKKHRDELEHPNKKTEIKMVLKNPVTLLRMSSNCNAKVYKNMVRSYFRNRFLYLINSVKSFEIR